MFYIPYNLGLTNKYRTHKYVKNIIDEKIISVYKKRFQNINLSEDNQTNILNLMVIHNKKSIERGDFKKVLDNFQIIGNIQLFLFAGFDTSLQGSISGLMWMNLKAKDYINTIIKADISDVMKTIENVP